mgnify:CR=1 FL=1
MTDKDLVDEFLAKKSATMIPHHIEVESYGLFSKTPRCEEVHKEYKAWAEEVGIMQDQESWEAWAHQQMKIDELEELLKHNENNI